LQDWLEAFRLWKRAIELSQHDAFEESTKSFSESAEAFFRASYTASAISKALNEYSTIMDSFAKTQNARLNMSNGDFDGALRQLELAAEIFRSSIHFAYMAPYVSACATLEVASGLEQKDTERFESFRNAVALFEQAKLGIYLNDDKDPKIHKIDMNLKLAISLALRAEGEALEISGDMESAERKYSQYIAVNNDYLQLVSETMTEPGYFEYFIADDYLHALNAAFISTFATSETIDLLNVGVNEARILEVGNAKTDCLVQPGHFASFPLAKTQKKGRMRIFYVDMRTGKEYSEAAIMVL
jgi:hypothetical protein